MGFMSCITLFISLQQAFTSDYQWCRMMAFRSGLALTLVLFVVLLSFMLLFDAYYLPMEGARPARPSRAPFGDASVSALESSRIRGDHEIGSSRPGAGLPAFCETCGTHDVICTKWGYASPLPPSPPILSLYLY